MFSWGVGDSNRKMITENPEPLFRRDSELLLELADDDTRLELSLLRVMTDIAAALINYRVENALSQKELAKRLECSQAMVSKIESGDYNFTIKKLFDIVNKLNGHVSVRIDFSDDNSDLDALEEEQVAIWESVNSQNIERMERSA